VAARIYSLAYKAVQAAPGAVGAEAQRQRNDALNALAKEIVKPDPAGVSSFQQLPANGLAYDDVLRQLELLAARDASAVGNQRCSGCVYWGNEAHSQFLASAQATFLLANPLHQDVFPSMGKFEKEIVRMTKVMLGAQPDDDVCGAVTSGTMVPFFLCCVFFVCQCHSTTFLVELIIYYCMFVEW
jgi:sphinganine-1-phosphate aldolase